MSRVISRKKQISVSSSADRNVIVVGYRLIEDETEIKVVDGIGDQAGTIPQKID